MACWPLNRVTLGACSTWLRLSLWAAVMKKYASTSLRIAKPSVAPAVGSSPPNCGVARLNGPLREGDVQVGGKDVGLGRGQAHHDRAVDVAARAGAVRYADCRRRGKIAAVDGAVVRHAAAAEERLSEQVVLDVEVEVHADLLGEVVVERNEPDFDGDLQVLQPPQLLQQVDDFLVDLLGLADDEAQVGLERAGSSRDRPRPPTRWAGSSR